MQLTSLVGKKFCLYVTSILLVAKWRCSSTDRVWSIRFWKSGCCSKNDQILLRSNRASSSSTAIFRRFQSKVASARYFPSGPVFGKTGKIFLFWKIVGSFDIFSEFNAITSIVQHRLNNGVYVQMNLTFKSTKNERYEQLIIVDKECVLFLFSGIFFMGRLERSLAPNFSVKFKLKLSKLTHHSLNSPFSVRNSFLGLNSQKIPTEKSRSWFVQTRKKGYFKNNYFKK